MPRVLIRAFRFEVLKISELLECSKLLIRNVFTPDKVQAVGLGKPYDDLIALDNKYSDILKHNPTLIETEPLTEDIARLRRLLGAFDSSLEVIKVTGGDAEKAEAEKAVSYVASPYLKGRGKSTMIALLGDAEDMCDALQDLAVAPKVDLLGLAGQVTAIKELAVRCNALIVARGEEKEYRKKLGTATKTRGALQKQYRFIFATILPAIYYTTTDPETKGILTTMLDEINAILDSLRYLTGGGTGDGNDDYSDPHKPVDPGTPDTQPANPPNGGTYIDPNA